MLDTISDRAEVYSVNTIGAAYGNGKSSNAGDVLFLSPFWLAQMPGRHIRSVAVLSRTKDYRLLNVYMEISTTEDFSSDVERSINVVKSEFKQFSTWNFAGTLTIEDHSKGLYIRFVNSSGDPVQQFWQYWATLLPGDTSVLK